MDSIDFKDNIQNDITCFLRISHQSGVSCKKYWVITFSVLNICLTKSIYCFQKIKETSCREITLPVTGLEGKGGILISALMSY